MKFGSLLLAFLLPALAAGTTITFVVPSGTTVNGLPVSGFATVTTGMGQMDIHLVNLQDNPKSVIQGFNGVSFVLPEGLAATGILFGSAEAVNIASDGSYTSLGDISIGWVLDSSGLMVGMLLPGGSGPAQLLLGGPDSEGIYSDANGSIAGNNPHNPFLKEGLDLTLSVPGMTPDTEVLGSTIYFGTASGQGVPLESSAPEPVSLTLSGVGLAGLAFLRLKRRE